jgi:hypothetical protein
MRRSALARFCPVPFSVSFNLLLFSSPYRRRCPYTYHLPDPAGIGLTYTFHDLICVRCIIGMAELQRTSAVNSTSILSPTLCVYVL